MMPKLLLADDSITVQRVIALTFQGEGIEVIAVGDGDLAVDAIDRERPQIVLADLSMPGRDGYAVAEYVKRSPELAKDIRVVLLTGAAEPVEEGRSRALGIDGVLSKPFEPHVATALVRRLLAEPPTVPGPRSVALEAGAASATPLEPRADSSAPPPSGVAAAAATGGSLADHTIAVDDYFRRLDEALATAGLSTSSESAADLAAIAVPGGTAGGRSTDAETVIMPRPAQSAPAADAGADAGGDTPKLVDAFSALLAAEEGDSGGFVAGPVEMEGAPAPVPSPAVEWTPGQAAAPVEAAADTVALQAIAVDAAETAAAEARAGAAATAAAADAEVSIGAASAPDTDAAGDRAVATRPLQAVPSAGAAEASAPEDAARETTDAGRSAAASAPPAALRADRADQSAIDGIDLDVFADAVAQKILHRLTDARIDAIVSERVLEIAERLVREEIERIKADAQ
jgi:CheY-like chemotaxis protein